MHYRNGREAKNGDKVIQLTSIDGAEGGKLVSVGVLFDAKPGSDYCNGNIAYFAQPVMGACMCDCLHVDDLAALLKEKGLDKRPNNNG